jgi:ATP-dependent Lon protease
VTEETLTKRQQKICLLENLLAVSEDLDDKQIKEQAALLQATLKSLKAEEAREQKVDQQIEKLEALLAARTGGDTRP